MIEKFLPRSLLNVRKPKRMKKLINCYIKYSICTFFKAVYKEFSKHLTSVRELCKFKKVLVLKMSTQIIFTTK